MQYLTLTLLLFLPSMVWSAPSLKKNENTKIELLEKYQVKMIETPFGIHENDHEACYAIADNINRLEQYNTNWKCDFPIAGNNYDLSKPPLREVSEKEKLKSLSLINQHADERVIYSYSHKIDGIKGDEKIYLRARSLKYPLCEARTQ